MYTYESKKEGKDQESIQSSTTPDPGYQWESNPLSRNPGSAPDIQNCLMADICFIGRFTFLYNYAVEI